MYKPTYDIQLGKYRFHQVKNGEIRRSANLLSDTAVIEMPLRFRFANNRQANTEKTIKRGDKVNIAIGNYGDNINEFQGYVSDVTAKNSVVKIACEDATFLLRKELKNKAFKKTKLKNVLQYILDNTNIKMIDNLPDVDISGFVIKNITALSALEKIKQDYGLSIFINYEGKLFTGLGSTYNTGNVKCNFNKDIAGNINSNLTFKKAEDIKLKIKAISVLKTNEKIEIEIGDADGELRTLHTYGIENKKQLKKWAENEMGKYKYTGYSGNFTTFIKPYVMYGMRCFLIDPNYPERAGSYYVESTTTTFGVNGVRRKIELGRKI